MKTETQLPTMSEIVEIVGPLDDAVLLEILQSGATAAEVLEAFTWVNANDQIGTETEHGPRGAVLRVCEILDQQGPEPDER
jgi:3-deoxy-D-manno-octulosonate 8-phosphate phosphatase KdsC-like HAD superfamily phosphatase